MSRDRAEITDVILGAGAARRFGARKLLADCAGQSLLERAVSVGRAAALTRQLVVVRAADDELLGALSAIGVPFVVNADAAHGPGTSIAAALRAVGDEADAVLLRPADLPLITAEDLVALVDAWREQRESIVCSQFSDGRGAPAVFPARCFDALRGLPADSGGRHLLRRDNEVRSVAVPAAAIDVDTPQDLAFAERMLLSRARDGRSARS